jgi:hypothetical protein
MRARKSFLSVAIILTLTTFYSSNCIARRIREEDLLNEVIRKLSINGKKFLWRNVPLEIQRQLLQLAAEELNIDIRAITSTILVRHEFRFLNGHTLNGMYYYYYDLLRNARENFGTLPQEIRDKITVFEIQRLTTIQFIRRILADYQSVDEVTKDLSTGKTIDWRMVPLEIQRRLLTIAMRELGKDIDKIYWSDFTCGYRFLNGRSLRGFHTYYAEILHKGKLDYRTLPRQIQDKISETDLQKIKNTMQFIRAVLDIPYPEGIFWRARGKRAPRIPRVDLKGADYTLEERRWIAEYQRIVDESRWGEISRENPKQIAFYVRELAICVASSLGGFGTIWDILLDDNLFRYTTVPCLDSTLVKLLNWFGDAYSILKFLEDQGLIEEINNQVRKRLKQ